MNKFFYLIGILVMMMSCGKDVDQFIPNASQGVQGDITRLTSKLKQDLSGEITYVGTVRCTGSQVFEIDKDLVLSFPPGFVDLNQYPCTNGYFDISVTVCDTKGEILISGIPTLSENKLLESRIECNIEIKNGNHSVKLAQGKKIGVYVKDPDPRDRMELFYGQDTDWLQADGDPTIWNNVANQEWTLESDSTFFTGFGYGCLSDSIDWINVDVFFDIPENQRTPVCVELPAQFTNKNTKVFMAFDDYNSITYMPGDSIQERFCEHYGSTPIGFKVTFVVIAELGEEDYYFASKTTNITPNLVESITPVKTPYESIKSYILGL